MMRFIRFLNPINRETLKHLAPHLIVDNYAAYKTPKVKWWLKRRPRIHMHSTPTSVSWLNLVERFFAEITRKRNRCSVFHAVVDLQMAINAYLAQYNNAPSPSSGPHPQVPPSKRSTVGNKRWNRNTRAFPCLNESRGIHRPSIL